MGLSDNFIIISKPNAHTPPHDSSSDNGEKNFFLQFSLIVHNLYSRSSGMKSAECTEPHALGNTIKPLSPLRDNLGKI